MKTTVILGASINPIRFSNKAVKSLIRHGYPVIPIGNREGKIKGNKILTGKPKLKDIHTISLYLNPKNQEEYYDYIMDIKPQRLIFNPGTENQELIELATQNNIEVNIACTLIMINNHKF